MRRSPLFVALLLAFAPPLVGVTQATDTEQSAAATPLPEPLNLDFALSLAESAHPDVVAATAQTAIAAAQRDSASSAYGIQAGIQAEATLIEPSASALDQSRNDSQASLVVSKRFYDFGHTRSQVAAAAAALNGSQLRYSDTLGQRSLTILERYLAVLRADLRFRVEDEAMAIAYVRVDRARDQHELGQISEISLLAAETRYQEARSARIAAQAQQRVTRVALAAALNRPGELSSNLEEPALDILATQPPALDAVMVQVLQENPVLRALRAESEAARERLQAARAVDRPVISGRAEASEYQRDSRSNDPWAVGLQLEVPLYSGGRSSAERARARAEKTRSEAQLARAELELREQAQALWEEIEVLRASRDEVQTRIDYRELYLDRSRALYEMEVNSDLGDALVVSSQARLRQAELEYQLLLAWARLNVLRGQALFATATQEDDTP